MDLVEKLHHGKVLHLSGRHYVYLFRKGCCMNENNSDTLIELAKKYYKALYQKDFNLIRNIASDSFSFSDPTAIAELGLPMKIDGVENFISYMDRYISPEMHINVQIIDVFESNFNVILYVQNTINVSGISSDVTLSKANEIVARGISALAFTEGKVVAHTDYFDYQALQASLENSL